ncbi:flagellar export protein FliJ [Leptospira sp. GIMC2001]|uniref:flagellar export protein FliJ n=1 Tax=Leptospira sp. GIMC2001 TaxID=1513297 RepID=UPI0023492B06|nr:flagellar export protein FliJ [Leptospira sp. GIMC2001]WCL48260.1 flagellar export protein FliJ [Leptospira sp. GIMC2001]
MKRFQFRLDPLITLRKRTEDDAIKSLSIVVSTINALNDEKVEFQKMLTESGNRLSTMGTRQTGIREYLDYADSYKLLNIRIENLNVEIEKKQPELDVARIRLNEARKEKEILLKLRERDYKKFRKRINKNERLELEEYITVTKHHEILVTSKIDEKKDISQPRVFKTISKQERDDENLPEDFKTLKSIYNQFLNK